MNRIYCVSIAGMEEDAYQALYHAASAERQTRADRYRNPADRYRCVAAEALLRFAVGEMLGSVDMTLDRTARGKPFLKYAPEAHFNLSHSGDWVVLAWSDSPVGLDVEQVPEMVKQTVMSRCFTPEEQAYAADSCERFAEIWTGKESYVKFLGTGLGTKLNSFSVLSMVDPIIQNIPLSPGYSLSLCSHGAAYTLAVLSLEALASK